MVTSRSKIESFTAEELEQLLLLEGIELQKQLITSLQTKTSSLFSCVLELDKFQGQVNTLAQAFSPNIDAEFRQFDVSAISRLVLSGVEQKCVVKQDLLDEYPTNHWLRQIEANCLVGMPLRNSKNEVIGALVSLYEQEPYQKDLICGLHATLANVSVHTLRARWLAARSDSLVNQLSYEVSHDNLTGLMNRSFLADKLETITETTDDSFTLVYLDIDNFKSINDLYGNYMGDQVIKFVAQTIANSVPEEQMTFRISGDEFAFITRETDSGSVCRGIIQRLKEGYTDTNYTISISASMGLAQRSDVKVTSDQLMLHASLALKDCKQTKNRNIQNYDTNLSAQYYRRTMVIDALRVELEKANIDDLEVYVLLQPIVNRREQRWESFEVLARWNSQLLGCISPVEFIEAAEQSGLIVDLGEKIFELACIAKQRMERGLGYKIKLSINCSAHELNDSTRYLGSLKKTLSKYEFSPNEFTLELTETVLLTQNNEVKYILSKLRSMGFKVALDDFGTGYSSLNYIYSYPIDCIKIDATFIRNMLSSETAEKVVWLIIQLAKQLEVRLVAEGVEDVEALEKLSNLGCDEIQGYFFSRPESPEKLIEQCKDALGSRSA